MPSRHKKLTSNRVNEFYFVASKWSMLVAFSASSASDIDLCAIDGAPAVFRWKHLFIGTNRNKFIWWQFIFSCETVQLRAYLMVLFAPCSMFRHRHTYVCTHGVMTTRLEKVSKLMRRCLYASRALRRFSFVITPTFYLALAWVNRNSLKKATEGGAGRTFAYKLHVSPDNSFLQFMQISRWKKVK